MIPNGQLSMGDSHSRWMTLDKWLSKESAVVLLKRTEENEHAINLEEGKKPPYVPIYSLGLVTLKKYIQLNLANGFIRPF